MNEINLEELINAIKPADPTVKEATWEHWDSLCKPLRGFGLLEEMVVKLAGIQETSSPHCDKRAVVIMGADNGVVEEGVSQTDSSVTLQVLENMGQKISSVCVMSKMIHAAVIPVNIGSNADGRHPAIINIPVRYGTGNIAKGPAMTRKECIQAIERGAKVVMDLKEKGYDIVLVGEMGIGNTTTSSACVAALFNESVENVTGRGAGLSSEGLLRKIDAIERALKVNQPDPGDPVDVIAKVGGLDIAGMVGCYLGAAACHMPAMIDGLISALSAYCAYRLCPACRDYMFASHATAEPAGKRIMEGLDLQPILYAGMHLGEATGAAAVLPLLDQALNVYYGLPGFADGNVEKYEHLK